MMRLSTEQLERIRAWQAAGFTQREMALHLGCSQSTLHFALSGKKRLRPERKSGQKAPRRGTKKVRCLRCGDGFITQRDRDGIPLCRLCDNCRKFNARMDAGALA
jgi:hypothetical protein